MKKKKKKNVLYKRLNENDKRVREYEYECIGSTSRTPRSQ